MMKLPQVSRNQGTEQNKDSSILLGSTLSNQHGNSHSPLLDPFWVSMYVSDMFSFPALGPKPS